MHEIPIRVASTTFIAALSGGSSVITEQTLLPLGIFVSCVIVLTVTAWKLSSAVTRASDQLSDMDNRIRAIEIKLNKD